MGSTQPSFGVKGRECVVDQFPQSSADTKNACSWTTAIQIVFMARTERNFALLLLAAYAHVDNFLPTDYYW